MTNKDSSTDALTRPLTMSSWGEFCSRVIGWLLPVTYFLVTISFYLKTYDSAQIKITLTQVGCGTVAFFLDFAIAFSKTLAVRQSGSSPGRPLLGHALVRYCFLRPILLPGGQS